jgi:predicted Zn-dependent protease
LSLLTEEEGRKLTGKMLGYATAPETRVYINPARNGNTRFARNDVTTSGYTETCVVQVESHYGLKVGNATTNQLDDASLADVVRRAEETARLAPDDPEAMPLIGPQTYPESPALFAPDTEAVTAGWRAQIATDAIAASKAKGLETSGIVQNYCDVDAMANSKGLFAFRKTTGVSYSLTARSNEDGSGWGGGVANTIKGFDAASMTARAVDLAVRTAKPVALEPGNYTTILSAECVADLARTLQFGFNQRSLDEGRSFLSKFQKELASGQRLFSEKVQIYSDPAAPECPGSCFDGEGQPTPKMDFVRDGVVKGIICSRYWAQKTGKQPVPFPGNLLMAGGTSTTDEMIASTKRGLLVTRFWYVRPVDPQTALFTGLTRDGCFLIEDGKVVRPVKNFRWNETPVKMLRNIDMMGPSRRVVTSEQDIGSTLCFPALKVTDFTFSSLSDAV